MEAAIDAGFRVVEFTLTIPGALDMVRAFSLADGLLVSVGTVFTAEDAHAAIDAVASCLVSPVLGTEVGSRRVCDGVDARDCHANRSVRRPPSRSTSAEDLPHAWDWGRLVKAIRGPCLS